MNKLPLALLVLLTLLAAACTAEEQEGEEQGSTESEIRTKPEAPTAEDRAKGSQPKRGGSNDWRSWAKCVEVTSGADCDRILH